MKALVKKNWNEMKTIFLNAILLLCSSVAAQEFAPIGSEWYYTNIESFFLPNQGYVKIESVGDTIIQEISTRRLTVTRFGSDGSIRSENDEFVSYGIASENSFSA